MKKKYDLLLSMICFAGCLVCLYIAFGPRDDRDPTEKLPDVRISVEQAETMISQENSDSSAVPDDFSDLEPKEGKREVCPVDFEFLQEKNKDIYAWITIPGTEIDYPILQSKEDDTFYLDHDSFGETQAAGAIFTENAYNGTDFMDPVTVIYGHKMRSGSRFGTLQNHYETQEEFQRNQDFTIYLPDRVLKYRVFAAVPYGREHLLCQYDFTEKEEFDDFLQKVFLSQGIFDTDITVNSRDHLVILSTCLKWNNRKRYLVIAKQME